MTSKPVEYAYTTHFLRGATNETIGGDIDIFPGALSERWNIGFHTINEAVEEARNVWREEHGSASLQGVYVAVAPYVPYEPNFSAYTVIEDLCENAEYEADEAAQDWEDDLDAISDECRQELHDGLKAVVCEWLKKYGLEPHFGSVDTDKARYYPLWEGATL